MSATLAVATPGAVDRRHIVGGSDIPAVLGISPWKTPYRLWVEKTAEHPLEEDPRKALFFRRRKMMEPFVIELAKAEHDLHVVAKNARYYDPELPFLSCEIDFEHEYEGSTENADVKTVRPSMAKEWGEPGTDEIPQYYTAQFLWGQMITGRHSTLCMAMIGIDNLIPYRVMRADSVIAWMREQALRFWELVEKRTPPPITTIEDARLAWQREQKTKQIVCSKEIAEIASRLALMKKVIAGDQAKAALLELDLMKFMGDAEELVDSNGERIATWKTQNRKSYTVAASEFRVLRLSGRE